MTTDTTTHTLSWLPPRLRMAIGLWLVGGVVLTVVASNAASMIALIITFLGIMYTYGFQHPKRLGGPADTPRPEIAGAAGSHVSEEAQHFILREFAAAQRGRPLALVMFGFPGFASFTERVGAAGADAAVVEFGRVLQRMTRRMNLSGRYGWRAETFLSVLSDADADGAQAFLTRVLDTIAKLEMPMPEIAAGIAVYQPHMQSPEDLVAAAERALVGARADARAPSAPASPFSTKRVSSRVRAV